MIKILLILFLTNLAYADFFKTEIKDEHIILDSSNKTSYIEDNINKLSIAIFNKQQINNNLFLDSNVEFFMLSKELLNYKNVSLKYNSTSGTIVKTLMISHKNEYFSIYAGVIPFNGGRFSEIKKYDYSGNGIELLIDQVLVGGFIKTNIYSVNVILGKANWEKEVNYISLHEKNDGSSGDYIIINKNIGNHYIELNYFNVHPKINKQGHSEFELGDLELVGIGYIYNDSFNTGFTLWCEVGYSKFKENTLANAINNNPYGKNGIPFLNNSGYATENRTIEGSAYKFGVKYSDVILNYDYSIGLEYFKTNSGWVSMNHGVLFNSNYSYWQNRDANQITVFSNIELNKNINIGAKYSYSKSEKVPLYFSIADVTEPSDDYASTDDFYLKNQRIEFFIKYSF